MKKQVHYALLEDMEKYIKDFNPKDYKESSNETDPSVIDFLRNYYDNNLPVDVTAWMRVNEPEKSLIYGECQGTQIRFVRDKLAEVLSSSYEEWENNPPMVISTHHSKSVKLPVYQINLEKYGIEIILRCNFYDWKISIKSDKPLEFDYMGLFDPTKEVSYLICEGFPRDKVYGSYEQNHSKFTIEIDSKYDVYTFFFLLKNYLGIKKED